jgi:hypothetical protein
MHVKKFALLYSFFLVLGLVLLLFQDFIFILSAKTQLALVDHYEPAKTETFYKLGGSYQEMTLAPVIYYIAGDKKYAFKANYACKDGCHKIGSKITIFYNIKEPSKILINSFQGIWKYKIYFLIFMSVLLLSALPYLYYKINKQP